MATATRTPLRSTPRARPRADIHVLDNPLRAQDAALARSVEAALHEVLSAEDLGQVDVRFRVCRELSEGLRFICKVENPPVHDIASHPRSLPWRWWSPLMETAQDFRAALQEAVSVRRERIATAALPAF